MSSEVRERIIQQMMMRDYANQALITENEVNVEGRGSSKCNCKPMVLTKVLHFEL